MSKEIIYEYLPSDASGPIKIKDLDVSRDNYPIYPGQKIIIIIETIDKNKVENYKEYLTNRIAGEILGGDDE